MRGRKGDWRDLLRAYALALGAKKVWLGLVGVLATMAIVGVAAMACGTLVERGLLPESNKVAVLVAPKDPGNVFQSVIDARVEFMSVEFHSEFPFVDVEALGSLALILPLLNPFGGNLLHFLLSILFYLALIAVWTRCGGIITRLAALEYARDDLPTAREAKDMVRARRRAYLLAPLIPLVGILFCALANILLGLASSIPWGVGPWLLAVGTVGSVFVTILMTFLIVVGALSFGLMVPVVSISGGDAFESWAASYSYTLWGFGRLVCYRLLTWVVGVAAVVFAALVAKVFLSVLVSSIGLGVVGNGSLAGSGPQALGVQVAAGVLMVLVFVTHCLVLAYAASYYFTANTIIAFLLRKHVDRIEVDQVYMEEEESEEQGEALGGMPGEEAPPEDAEEREQPSEDEAAPPEGGQSGS